MKPLSSEHDSLSRAVPRSVILTNKHLTLSTKPNTMLKRLSKRVVGLGAEGLAHLAFGREKTTDKENFYDLVSPAGT